MDIKEESEKLTREDKKCIKNFFREFSCLELPSDESSDEDFDSTIDGKEQIDSIESEQLSPRTKKKIIQEVVYSFLLQKTKESLFYDSETYVKSNQDAIQEPNEHIPEPPPTSVETYKESEKSYERKHSECDLVLDSVCERSSSCGEQNPKNTQDEIKIELPERKYSECNVVVGAVDMCSPQCGEQDLKDSKNEMEMKSPESKYSECSVVVDSISLCSSLCGKENLNNVKDEIKVELPVKEEKESVAEKLCRLSLDPNEANLKQRRSDESFTKSFVESRCSSKLTVKEEKESVAEKLCRLSLYSNEASLKQRRSDESFTKLFVESSCSSKLTVKEEKDCVAERLSSDSDEANLKRRRSDENFTKCFVESSCISKLTVKEERDCAAEKLSSGSDEANLKRRRSSDESFTKFYVESRCNSKLTDDSKNNLRDHLKQDCTISQCCIKTETLTSYTQKTEIVKKKSKHNNSFYDNVCYKPMLDRKGRFFISRAIVQMYQDGLRKQWNPTQCVYELCVHCDWEGPKYVQISYSMRKGYLFDVVVNKRVFRNMVHGNTKKSAKHYASTKFLQFLGFRFRFEDQKSIPQFPLKSESPGFGTKQSNGLQSRRPVDSCCALRSDRVSSSVLKKRKVTNDQNKTCAYNSCCCCVEECY